MEITVQKVVLCAVTDDFKKVAGVPVFQASTEDSRQEKAQYLSRILEGVVHNLGDGVLIVVKH